MLRRSVDLEVISVTPREECSDVQYAERAISCLRGFSELSEEQQVATRHYAGTVAEFWGRRVHAYRLPPMFSRDNLYGSFVGIEAVLAEAEALQTLSVPQRWHMAAELIAQEKTIREICEHLR